jgi:hypothetical protein
MRPPGRAHSLTSPLFANTARKGEVSGVAIGLVSAFSPVSVILELDGQ